jgi:hypothetical protein
LVEFAAARLAVPPLGLDALVPDVNVIEGKTVPAVPAVEQ